MYTAQGECILDLEPDAVCLEQVAHIMKVDKDAVTDLYTTRNQVYVVHSAVVNCWVYGDVSNRERLIIVAIHRKFGAWQMTMRCPEGISMQDVPHRPGWWPARMQQVPNISMANGHNLQHDLA